MIKAWPLLAASAMASLTGVNYPRLPNDRTTPVQQRLAVYGPTGEKRVISYNLAPKGDAFYSCFRWLEHLREAQQQLRVVQYFAR